MKMWRLGGGKFVWVGAGVLPNSTVVCLLSYLLMKKKVYAGPPVSQDQSLTIYAIVYAAISRLRRKENILLQRLGGKACGAQHNTAKRALLG